MRGPRSVTRDELRAAAAPLFELLGDVNPDDVLALHIGASKATVKTVRRSSRGSRIQGVTTTTEHRITTEAEE